MKRFFIKTFGCQMNVYDSSRMGSIMTSLGYTETSEAKDADVIIINTCHIREKPTEKVFSELGRFSKQKKENPELIIVVTGCVVQAKCKEIMTKAPIIDIALGPQSYHFLAQALERVIKNKEKHILIADFPKESKFNFLPPICRQPFSAFLAIQEGCDRFCSYCVVPYTRGREYSRPLENVIEEAKEIVKNGAKEITLLGQNVNAWHGLDKKGETRRLEDLIYSLAEIEDLKRIRFVTSYPSEMTDALINVFAKEKKLMPYLHLPVQSGSDKVLKAMNRRYTRLEYLELVAKIRKTCPEIALSSDFIVGFAGETDEDFADTLDLVEKVNFASSFSFKYSPRPDTRGAKMQDQIPEEIKTNRLIILQELLQKQQKAFNLSCIGKNLDVLIEGKGKNEDELVGHSPYMQTVLIKASESNIGKIVSAEITSAGLNNLKAKI